MRSVFCVLCLLLFALVDLASGAPPRSCPNGQCGLVVVGPLGRVSAPAGYRVERRRLGIFRIDVVPTR